MQLDLRRDPHALNGQPTRRGEFLTKRLWIRVLDLDDEIVDHRGALAIDDIELQYISAGSGDRRSGDRECAWLVVQDESNQDPHGYLPMKPACRSDASGVGRLCYVCVNRQLSPHHLTVVATTRPNLRWRDTQTMNEFLIDLYGEPCRECGFSFETSASDAIALIEGLPEAFDVALGAASGPERHPDLEWSVTAYVLHVADNLRIWAERLAGSATGAGPNITAYDENILAAARNYAALPLQAARWSLTRAVADYLQAVRLSPTSGTVLNHPEQGALTLVEVLRADTHDALHHRWDIERTLAR